MEKIELKCDQLELVFWLSRQVEQEYIVRECFVYCNNVPIDWDIKEYEKTNDDGKSFDELILGVLSTSDAIQIKSNKRKFIEEYQNSSDPIRRSLTTVTRRYVKFADENAHSKFLKGKTNGN